MGLRKDPYAEVHVTMENDDGFRYYSAVCPCGWSSVAHHQHRLAYLEGAYHAETRDHHQDPDKATGR